MFVLNIRIKFQKYGVMRFVGHLDIMRYFQKSLRRANISVTYSEGYNPHQIMSFAAPLGVGVTSDGEYLDIEVTNTNSSEASIEALNDVMVDGVSILEYKKLPDTAKTSMALVAAADYLLIEKPGYNVPFEQTQWEEKLNEFYQQEEILITKQTKKSETVMDLKPLIYKMTAVDLEDKELLRTLKVSSPDMNLWSGTGMFLQVCTGSITNIKPELVLEAFYDFCGLSLNPLAFQVHRLEVYANSDVIAVKGEKERQAYQLVLEQKKAEFAQKQQQFPRFSPLGDFGEIIY
ncbi:MAG: TIGR03936 family radical SAM-associated protein [Lachnospiraceae bacterium]